MSARARRPRAAGAEPVQTRRPLAQTEAASYDARLSILRFTESVNRRPAPGYPLRLFGLKNAPMTDRTASCRAALRLFSFGPFSTART